MIKKIPKISNYFYVNKYRKNQLIRIGSMPQSIFRLGQGILMGKVRNY